MNEPAQRYRLGTIKNVKAFLSKKIGYLDQLAEENVNQILLSKERLILAYTQALADMIKAHDFEERLEDLERAAREAGKLR